MQWTKSKDQDLSVDYRGWKKGKSRSYSQRDEERILRIHRELDADPQKHFSGASAILQRYQERYPREKPISLRFIGRTLAKHGLSSKPKVRRKGVSRYLHYPETTINLLGKSLLEVDFIGKKFITGRTEPVNFIAFSLRFPRKLKYFQRIESETADEVIKHCRLFFQRFEKPQVVKLDNGFAFASAGPHPRVLNSVVLFLIKEKIIPVFTAPRKPWNQASIEGANSIFSRKFWNRIEFSSLKDIDKHLVYFNRSYKWYTGYQRPKRLEARARPYIPKVCFIRKVYEDPETGHAYIEILKEQILLPRSYINMFTLAEWNLKSDRLTVYYEDQLKAKVINRVRFSLNPIVKQKVF
jgi:hypothetical protein